MVDYVSQEVPPPPPVLVNVFLEYEVEDILDVRACGHGHCCFHEFLVEWVVYGLYDATWEAESSLFNC